MCNVGVDLMGGESPPEFIFEAILQAAEQFKSKGKITVFATHSVIPELKKRYSLPKQSNCSIDFVATEEFVDLDESPLFAVRRKKKSSMSIGIQFLRNKKIDAFVSMGNTGALVANAMLHLPFFPGIERPALLVMLPLQIAVLDVGAHIATKAGYFLSYAFLGSLFQKVVYHVEEPKIGLLNIGVEAQKGTREVKEAYQLLKENFQEHFVGNVEGREVFTKKVDVLVTDGFTGNVFLKTSEGVSAFLIEYLREHFPNWKELSAHLDQKFNYSEHSGAVLLGVDGLLIKCHGHSNVAALRKGILRAFSLAEQNVIEKMKALIAVAP